MLKAVTGNNIFIFVISLVVFLASMAIFKLDMDYGRSPTEDNLVILRLLVAATLACVALIAITICFACVDFLLFLESTNGHREEPVPNNVPSDREIIRRKVATRSEGNASLYRGSYITQEVLDDATKRVLEHNFKKRNGQKGETHVCA